MGLYDTEKTTEQKAEQKPALPPLYKVLLHHDDYTPMEFVIYVLEHIFNKTAEESMNIMLHVHQKGVGVCGVYTMEIAETKAMQVMELALKNEHPLQCTVEKDA